MERNGFLGILVTLVACLVASPAEAAWSGKCVSVSDGDTIKVMHDGKARKIRLFGVDCPERNQDFGNSAKQFTSSMVFGKVVTVQIVDRDVYGRTVAWISVHGVSLNHELVRAGMAWWFRKHAGQHKDLKQLEQEARKAKIGLWSHPNPIPPWKFRWQHR